MDATCIPRQAKTALRHEDCRVKPKLTHDLKEGVLSESGPCRDLRHIEQPLPWLAQGIERSIESSSLKMSALLALLALYQDTYSGLGFLHDSGARLKKSIHNPEWQHQTRLTGEQQGQNQVRLRINSYPTSRPTLLCDLEQLM